MKIALVLSVPPGYSETFFTNKIQVLRKSGFQVEIFTDQKGPQSEYKTHTGFSFTGHWRLKNLTSVLKTSFRLLRYFGTTRRLFLFNKADRFSIRQNIRSLFISAHIIGTKPDWIYFGFATICINRENLARAMGARLAVSIRGFDVAIYSLKNPGCYDLLWRRIDRLHYISDDLLNLAYKNGLSENVNSIKITPAVDTSIFSPASIQVQMDKTNVSILTVARLEWKKGLIYTLRGLSMLKEAGFDFKYTIIGGGSETERVIYAIHELGLQDKVTLTGAIPQEQIVSYLEHTDLYIQYSIQEGFSNAVLEAQAMGALCVVSDAEGLAENVLHQQTGWVVPKRRPDLLAKQIETVIHMDAEALQKVRQQAVMRVQNEFNLDNQQDAFIRFYET